MTRFFFLLAVSGLGLFRLTAADSTQPRNEVVFQSGFHNASNFLSRGFALDGMTTGVWNPSLYYRGPEAGGSNGFGINPDTLNPPIIIPSEISPRGFFMEVMPFSLMWHRRFRSDLVGWIAVRNVTRLWIRADADLARFLSVGNPPGSYYHWRSGHLAAQRLTAVQVGVRRSGWRLALGVGQVASQQVIAEAGSLYFPESADTIALTGVFEREMRAADAIALMFSLGWERTLGPWRVALLFDDWGLVFSPPGTTDRWNVQLAARAADPFDTVRRETILTLLEGGLDSLEGVSVSTSTTPLPPVTGDVKLALNYTTGGRTFFLNGMVWPMGYTPYWRIEAGGDVLSDRHAWVVRPLVQWNAAGVAGFGVQAGYRKPAWEVMIKVPYLLGLPRKTSMGAMLSLRMKI